MSHVNKRILIIPEGWCEYNYAQSLKSTLPRDKQRSITVEMPKPNNENSALQLLGKALAELQKAKRDKNAYDAIWIFFDHDNQPGLMQFFQRLNNTTVQIAYSSICFEHWFIIHFENNRQAYANANQALEKIDILWKNQFNQAYHKTKINHFEKLKALMPTAIQRADAIHQQVEKDGMVLVNRNPYFTVQKLITYFNNL